MFQLKPKIGCSARGSLLKPNRWPCYVFCICMLTNKYQKYKSVELGDQLGPAQTQLTARHIYYRTSTVTTNTAVWVVEANRCYAKAEINLNCGFKNIAMH